MDMDIDIDIDRDKHTDSIGAGIVALFVSRPDAAFAPGPVWLKLYQSVRTSHTDSFSVSNRT